MRRMSGDPPVSAVHADSGTAAEACAAAPGWFAGGLCRPRISRLGEQRSRTLAADRGVQDLGDVRHGQPGPAPGER